jgi:hypothetical protein
MNKLDRAAMVGMAAVLAHLRRMLEQMPEGDEIYRAILEKRLRCEIETMEKMRCHTMGTSKSLKSW